MDSAIAESIGSWIFLAVQTLEASLLNCFRNLVTSQSFHIGGFELRSSPYGKSASKTSFARAKEAKLTHTKP